VPRILPGEKGKRCVTILIIVVNSISIMYLIIAGISRGVAAVVKIVCCGAFLPGRKSLKNSRGI